MADAGGGSEWGTFEIIIILILVIGLLSQLTGHPIKSITSDTNTGTVSSVGTTDSADAHCGLYIARPHSLESVSGVVTLAGQTEGCDWQSTDKLALYAVVIDAKGTPISDYMHVSPTSFIDNIATFSTSIDITGAPTKGNGYLMLISAVQSSTTYRIPLRFK